LHVRKPRLVDDTPQGSYIRFPKLGSASSENALLDTPPFKLWKVRIN